MGNIKSILIIFSRPCDNLKQLFGITALSIISVLIPKTVMAQETMDSTGLKQLVKDYQKVWNTRDAMEVAKFFTEDADMIFGNFPASRGREAIEAWWKGYFNRQEPGRRGWFDITSIKFLTPVIALIALESTTGIAKDTSTYRKARGNWLVNKNSGHWMISALQGLPSTKDHVELVASLETTEHLRPTIRAFVTNYEETYNQHNPEELSKFYTTDADIIVREKPEIRGKDAIEAWWKNYFSLPRPFLALFIIDDIRELSDNIAILSFTVTGATPAMQIQSQPLPVREARARWIIVRKNGKWLITSIRVLPSIYDRVIRH